MLSVPETEDNKKRAPHCGALFVFSVDLYGLILSVPVPDQVQPAVLSLLPREVLWT